MELIGYVCPECRQRLTQLGEELQCPNHHRFEVTCSNIPVFAEQDEGLNEYTVSNAAEIHENALKWLFKSFGEREASFREGLIDQLGLQPGQRILVTGAGAGNDLPYIAEKVGQSGTVFAQDISREMLIFAANRVVEEYGLQDYDIHFSISDASILPFGDDCFDAVFHFGGLNLFPDVAKGISEMDRVVKEGGRVMFGDEGMAPWLKNSEYSKVIINNNPLCDYSVPIALLPETARDVQLTWLLGNSFYLIKYTSCSDPLPLDMDVPHLGTRGGTIRTRYFGKLEGIDPDLKRAIYSEAAEAGVSRVDFIERLLKKGLSG